MPYSLTHNQKGVCTAEQEPANTRISMGAPATEVDIQHAEGETDRVNQFCIATTDKHD